MARAGVTQTVLANALGVSQVAVSGRVRGLTAWRIDELAATAEFLNVPLTSLLDGTQTTAGAA